MTYQYVGQITTKAPNALSDRHVFALLQGRPMSPALRRAVMGEGPRVFVFRKGDKKESE